MLSNLEFSVLIDSLSTAIAEAIAEQVKTKLAIHLSELEASVASKTSNLCDAGEIASVVTTTGKDKSKQKAKAKQVEIVTQETLAVQDTPLETKGDTNVETTKASRGLPAKKTVNYLTHTTFKVLDNAKELHETGKLRLKDLPSFLYDGYQALNKVEQNYALAALCRAISLPWADVITGAVVIPKEQLLELATDEDKTYADYNCLAVADVFKKIVKLSKKKEREYTARQRVLEAQEKKRIASALKQKQKIAESPQPDEAEPTITSTLLYTPTIAKIDRPKVGIIGLHQGNQQIISTHFGNTFDLAMVDSCVGLAKIRTICDTSDKVFMMRKFISHTHVDLVDKSKMVMVNGAMTEIKKALSEFARTLVPQAT